MAHDVFISYSSKDKIVADAIVSTLENNQIRCWYAPRDIKPGDDWGEAITTAIEGCRVFLVVFSSDANRSQRVLDEVNLAISQQAIIIPFRIENLEPKGAMKLHLSSRHWLDAYDPSWQSHLQKLVSNISSNLSKAIRESDVFVPDSISRGKDIKRGIFLGIGAAIIGFVAIWYLLPPSGFGIPALLNGNTDPITEMELSEIETQGSATPQPIIQENEAKNETQDPDNYEFCFAGTRCEDREVSNESGGYADVLWLESSIEGETINISFQLADIPEEFTINREEATIDRVEYSWIINFDLDGDSTTGYGSYPHGVDYMFQIAHVKFVEGEETGRFEDVFEAELMKWVTDDGLIQFDKLEFFVDYDTKIVSSSFTLPGINSNSILYMNTYDDLNFNFDNLDDIETLQKLGIITY